LVRGQVADARLIIAGAPAETPWSDQPAPPGVEYRGFVEDLNALYASARVVCSPIVHGSGTRLKLIEAAAFARPMVSTSMGAEGLAFQDGRDILLRENDAELANACVRLLRDDALCRKLGAAARATMMRLYDAHSIEQQIVEMIRDAIRS
jgi:glycosyltransferase involved in cell wall biosynthesis